LTLCKNCGKAIKWFKDPVNDKWIPLEYDCDLEYGSPEEVDMNEVAKWKHKCTAVLRCNKGCGTEIYFDPDNKSPSGKLIPMGVATHENHTCSGSRRQEEFEQDMDYSI
jgi:hypothetical protein